MGGLIVGTMIGKTLSASIEKPFIAINHLEAHALIPRLTSQLNFPYLLLLASGGHCQFMLVNNSENFKLIGYTIDDSAGEVLDKVAKYLNLKYPGGPEIERLAKRGNENYFYFPEPSVNKKKEINFSFSGLKTAVMQEINSNAPINKKIYVI